jgi:rhodanese-related sulfurtransferase
VLVDEDENVARRAAGRLARAGYANVHVLSGGTRNWAACGYPLFAGVNVPSKAFGEIAEHAYHTPHVTAAQLAQMLERGDDVVVLDGRPFAEYQKMNIPGAICCPNGELALRIPELVRREDTRIVINCAGRTRSIIGAQTLINLGVRNPVFALQNGTQGWYLEGHELQRGSAKRYPAASVTGTQHPLHARAQALAERCGVPEVDATTVAGWLTDPSRTTFVLDVRTPEEYRAGPLAGAAHAPGGQLVQATDQYVGVRRARLVLLDNDGIRARVTGSWLRQMGHEAWVLKDGVHSGLKLPPSPEVSTLPQLRPVDAASLGEALKQKSVLAVDVRASMEFRRGHAPGAVWSIRPRIAAQLAGETRPVALVADDPAVAALAASELPPDQQRTAMLLEGGLTAWHAANLPVHATPDDPANADCIDFLFFVHDRHDGNKEAARRYLAWELGLVEQMHPQDRAIFTLPA